MDRTPEDRPPHFTELTTLRPVPLHTSLVPRAPDTPRAASGDSVDFVQLWETITEHSRLILGVTVAVFLLVMAVTAASRMDFRSTGRLYLGELDASTPEPNDDEEAGAA